MEKQGTKGHRLALQGQEVRLPRQAVAVLSREHHSSGMRLAFYKDHSVSFWRKMNVAGGRGVRGVSKHERPAKKCIFLWEGR